MANYTGALAKSKALYISFQCIMIHFAEGINLCSRIVFLSCKHDRTIHKEGRGSGL